MLMKASPFFPFTTYFFQTYWYQELQVKLLLVSFDLSVCQCSSEAKDHFYSRFQCKVNEAGISRARVTLLCYFNLQQKCSRHPRHFWNSVISNDPLIHSLSALYHTTLLSLTSIPFSPSHTIRSALERNAHCNVKCCGM